MAATYDPATVSQDPNQVPDMLRRAIYGQPDASGNVSVTGDPNNPIPESEVKTPTSIPGGEVDQSQAQSKVDAQYPDSPGVTPPPLPALVGKPAPNVSAGANTTPMLAPQGSSNQFIHALERAAGAVGAQPEPGQPYSTPLHDVSDAAGITNPIGTKPTTLGEKIGRIIQIAGGVGAGLGTAAGTPTQKELSAQSAQFGPQFREKVREARANEAIQAQYRGALAQYELGRNQTAEDVASIRSQPGLLRAQLSAVENGQVVGPDGQLRPLTQAEIANNPFAQAALDIKQSKDQLQAAQAAWQSARPGIEKMRLEQQITALRASLGFKAQNLGLRAEEIGLRSQALNMKNFEDLHTYGGNANGDVLNTSNALPGEIMDANGNVIGSKSAMNVRPTQEQRGQAGQADIVARQGQNVIDFIQRGTVTDPQTGQQIAVKDVIGPVMSRYNSLRDYIGDPQAPYPQLQAELMSFASLQPALHKFRSQKAAEHFEALISGKSGARTPDAIVGAIQGIMDTAGTIRQEGTPLTFGGFNPSASQGGPTSSVPPLPQARTKPRGDSKGESGGGASNGHVINYQGQRYQYKGKGDTADIKNYSLLPATTK